MISAIKEALRTFHNTAKAEGYFALTTIWNNSEAQTFESEINLNETLANLFARAIIVTALDYEVDAPTLAQDIATEISAKSTNEKISFESALEKFNCLFECYGRFKHDNAPENKTFYSEYEEKLYNVWYKKTCTHYEKVIGAAAQKVSKS